MAIERRSAASRIGPQALEDHDGAKACAQLSPVPCKRLEDDEQKHAATGSER
jgi:hypothetical protein